jgi:hypothetical protein
MDDELTFGERAVGLSFNPGGREDVDACKRGFAAEIDRMNDLRNDESTSPEKKRLASVAITELQGAQMWAVKALTWAS